MVGWSGRGGRRRRRHLPLPSDCRYMPTLTVVFQAQRRPYTCQRPPVLPTAPRRGTALPASGGDGTAFVPAMVDDSTPRMALRIRVLTCVQRCRIPGVTYNHLRPPPTF